VPAVLLPVRLETRFVDTGGGAELWLRFYPDQISVFTHEPELSPAEEAAGTAYWETRYSATTTLERKAAWQLLSGAYGPERAAWIARVLRPGNLGSGDPAPQFPSLSAADRRDSSWERAPIAVGLPDRWAVALLNSDSDEYRREPAAHPVRTPLQIGLDPNGQLTPDPTGAQIDEGMRWMFDFDEAVEAGMAMKISLSPEERTGGFRRLIAYGLRGGDGSAMLAAILRAHRYTDRVRARHQARQRITAPAVLDEEQHAERSHGHRQPSQVRGQEWPEGRPVPK
jgi:hypothetical protein